MSFKFSDSKSDGGIEFQRAWNTRIFGTWWIYGIRVGIFIEQLLYSQYSQVE